MNQPAKNFELPNRPRLRRTFSVVPMAPDKIQLRAGDERIVLLEGEFVSTALPALLPLLDGTRTAAAIASELSAELDSSEVMGGMRLLHRRGLLEDAADWPEDLTPAEESVARYLINFGCSASALREVLRGTSILCVGEESFAERIREALVAHGYARTAVESSQESLNQESVREVDLVVYAEVRASLFAEEALNPLCLETRTPWLHASVAPGHHGVLGPLFVPPHTGCYGCYRRRIRLNTASPEELAAVDDHLGAGGTLSPFGSPPAHQRIIAELATTEILKHHLRYRSCRLYDRLLTIDFLDHRTWEEPVWRLPQCPRCGPSGAEG